MKTNQWIKPFLFTLLIIIAPIVAYYLYFVEARETFLLERFHAHLANTAVRTEARFSSAFDVMRYNARQPNELGLTTRACDDQGEAQSGTVSRATEGALTLVYGTCHATADTTVLVGQLDAEGHFNDVVIVDGDNSVVFQQHAESGRIGSDQLLAQGDDSKAMVSDPFAGMRVTYQGRTLLVFSQPLVVSPEAVAAAPTPASGAAASSSPEATPARPVAASWRIVGLLDEGDFNSLKYSVSASNIALVTLIVLTALFGGPFLKLWYLGRFEPLTRFDLLFMIGAGLCLVAMGTVALLAWRTSTHLSGYFDDRLEHIARDTRDAIADEFRRAVDTLYALEPAMVAAHTERRRTQEDVRENRAGRGKCRVLAGTYEGSPPLSATGGPAVAGDVLVELPDQTRNYRQVKMAYVMDQDGCQLVKWASVATWTNPGQFKDRRYFLRALPNERAPLVLFKEGGEEGREYFQEVIVSRTTGEREIAFSKPVANRAPCTDAIREQGRLDAAGDDAAADERPAPVPCVSVVTARLRALESVFPFGYGVMLLDADSNIVLRADGDASTEINLANEVDAGEQLRTMVKLAIETNALGRKPLLDADYQMSPTRFRIEPLGVGNLALVVFYDRNLILTTVLEAVGAAVVAWLIWASILVTIFLAIWIADHVTERTLRTWPVLVIGLPGLLGLAWFVVGVPGVLLLAAAGIPLMLLPLLFLTREGHLRVGAQIRRLTLTFAIWFAVMLAAVLPMKVFYDDAELRTLAAMTRVASQEFEHAVGQQEASFKAWKYRVRLGTEEWPGFEVWTNQRFFEGPEQAGSADDPCRFVDIVCLILRNLPDYNDAVSRAHAVYRAGMPDARAVEPVRDELLFGRRGGDVVRPDSVPDTYGLLLTVAWTFFVLTAVAIWYLLMRTFGLRAENIVETSPFTLPDNNQPARWMVWGVPPAQRRKLLLEHLPKDATLWLDLRHLPTDAQIDIPPSTEAVVLDEFDSRLNDIEVVQQRVDLLDRLLRENRRIVLLFVSTDPLNFVTSLYDPEKNAVLLSRFALASSPFKWAYHGTTAKKAESTSLASVVARSLKVLFRRIEPFDRPGWRLKLVANECRHPDLWEIRDGLLAEAEAREWSKGQIIQQVHSRASAIYQRMWAQCTRVEKFTLIELARGNPMNPNNWDAARRLAVRGHLLIDPFYRIGSESLREFVGRMALVEDVQSWDAASPGAWNQIKVPLIVLFIGIMIFVGVTQPGMFNAMVAFVAAGAATLPFLASALNARLQRAVASDK